MEQQFNAPVFDISGWLDRYPVEEILQEYGTPEGLHHLAVTSPFGLVALEKLRQLVLRNPKADSATAGDMMRLLFWGELRPAGTRDLSTLRSKPTDVFVFQEGRPPRRDLTQIGGLPYRARNAPWPRDRDGAPMTFVAQLRFAESKDIVPSIPGDILLIFVDASWPDEVKCEWRSLGSEDLVESDDVPEPGWNFVHCWGHRYRSCDYCDESGAFESPRLSVSRAVKIGGCPALPMVECDMDQLTGRPVKGSIRRAPLIGKPDRFLCRLNSICPTTGVSYPWMNHPEPLEVDDLRLESGFDIGDGRGIDLFLDGEGREEWQLTE